MKRCAGCYDNSNGLGRMRGSRAPFLPSDAERCPRCGRRIFFSGKRIPRTLWPALSDEGPDTIEPDGTPIGDIALNEVRQLVQRKRV